MTPYYEALKQLIDQSMIADAASIVKEKETHVESAVTSIIAGFLGVFLKRGDNEPQIISILDEAGNLDILDDAKKIFQDNPSLDQQRLGDMFTEALLGNKAVDFSTHIAHHAKISEVSTNKLVSMVAPVVAGFLGNKMTKEHESIEGLIRNLNVERGKIAENIPPLLVNSFGIAPAILDITEKKEQRKKRNAIIWGVIILLLILLAFLLWRSCGTGCCKNKAEDKIGVVIAKTTTEVQALKIIE